jgi:hypothetical protein
MVEKKLNKYLTEVKGDRFFLGTYSNSSEDEYVIDKTGLEVAKSCGTCRYASQSAPTHGMPYAHFRCLHSKVKAAVGAVSDATVIITDSSNVCKYFSR